VCIAPIHHSLQRHTSVLRTLVFAVASLAVVAGCGSTSSTSSSPTPTTFDEIDQLIDQRIATEGLDGAGVLVVSDGTVYREKTYGKYSGETIIPIASASKWLTAATMMTLVDDRLVSLDDPVQKFLPQFTGPSGQATVRQLLSHTSGIGNAVCIWDTRQSLEQCVNSIATQKSTSEPGTKFSYGNASFSVAGRIIEVVTGLPFEKAFETRIAKPLGMIHTRFDGYTYDTESNPVPAASAESTMDDYGRFLKMISNLGEVDGVRFLSEQSVLEMEKNAVTGLVTNNDSAIRTTGIPTYGLGTWRDVTTTDDVGVVTSGNGAYGFYPWVDRSRNGYGIVAVFDQRGSELAVPESQAEMHLIFGVLDALGVQEAPTSTTTYRRR